MSPTEVNPWRTVYSRSQVKAAHSLIARAVLAGVAVVIIGYKSEASNLYWILCGSVIGGGLLLAFRMLSSHVSTSEEGIHAVNNWSSFSVRWGEIENILAASTQATRRTRGGFLYPPPEAWGEMIAKDSRIVLVDPSKGPERIRQIIVVTRSSGLLRINGCDRYTWEALTEAWEWNEENFARPLNFDRFDP